MKKTLTPAVAFAVLVLAACHSRIMPDPPGDRDGLLPVAGAVNIRDLGGIAGHEGRTIRWGSLVRSGNLDSISRRGVDFLFYDMGITTVVDLRTTRIVFVADGDGLDAAAFHATPSAWLPYGVLWPGNTGIGESIFAADFDSIIWNRGYHFDDVVRRVAAGYRDLVIQNRGTAMHRPRDQYMDFFRALLAADGPVLFHCSTGKDRTGVAAALLLMALGVSEADIVADYLFSLDQVRENYFAVVPAVRRNLRDSRAKAVAVAAGDPAAIARLRDSVSLDVRRRAVQDELYRHMEEPYSEWQDAAGTAADSVRTNQDIPARIDAAFGLVSGTMAAVANMDDVQFAAFAIDAANKVGPFGLVLEPWIRAAMNQVTTWGGIEAFLDYVFPDDPARNGAYVVNRLRAIYLEGPEG